MGKYSLGNTSLDVSDNISKSQLFVDEKHADKLVSDIENELSIINKSFMKVQLLINQSVNVGAVSGKRGSAFKAWAKKAKSQASQVDKLRDNLDQDYHDDVKDYPIQKLDQRIAELEKKIESMAKKM